MIYIKGVLNKYFFSINGTEIAFWECVLEFMKIILRKFIIYIADADYFTLKFPVIVEVLSYCNEQYNIIVLRERLQQKKRLLFFLS